MRLRRSEAPGLDISAVFALTPKDRLFVASRFEDPELLRFHVWDFGDPKEPQDMRPTGELPGLNLEEPKQARCEELQALVDQKGSGQEKAAAQEADPR